jgi:hypothetical protein
MMGLVLNYEYKPVLKNCSIASCRMNMSLNTWHPVLGTQRRNRRLGRPGTEEPETPVSADPRARLTEPFHTHSAELTVSCPQHMSQAAPELEVPSFQVFVLWDREQRASR